MQDDENRATLQDAFPPPPWFGLEALRRWRPGAKFKTRLEADEGTYFLKETIGYRGTVRGEIRFYRGKHTTAPLWPGEALLYYDVVIDEGVAKQVTIIETLTSPELQHRGFGSVLVRLMEDRARQYEVPTIRGHAMEESEAFWIAQGYTLRHEGARRVIEKQF